MTDPERRLVALVGCPRCGHLIAKVEVGRKQQLWVHHRWRTMGPDTARPGERREWLPNGPALVIPGRTFLPCWCREAACAGVFLLEPERVGDLFEAAERRGAPVRRTPGPEDVERSEALLPKYMSYTAMSAAQLKEATRARVAPRPPLVDLRTIHARASSM